MILNLILASLLLFSTVAASQQPMENLRVMPDSFFVQNLDRLQATTTPTHLILSGYLRKSMTFSLYAKVMSHFGVEGEYLPYELPLKEGAIDREALQRFLEVFRANPHLQTLIVSDPYKQMIIDYLDGLTDIAQAIKTVNLVHKRDGELLGDNIEAASFLLGAQEEIAFECDRHSMLFFGCGGVSSAIAYKLAPKLKVIGLVDINVERRHGLAMVLKKVFPSTTVIELDRNGALDFSEFDIFYNGTGLGKFSNDPQALSRSPLVEGDMFPKTGLAIDANYTPWKTRFLEQMTDRGFQTLNGFSHMLGCVSLHLSSVSGKEIVYSAINEILNPPVAESPE